MDEAAHGVHVDVAVGCVVLDVRRIGEQDELYPHTPLGPPAGELLDILTSRRKFVSLSYNKIFLIV